MLRGIVRRGSAAAVFACLLWLMPGPAAAWRPADLFKPCTGDCAVAVYAGKYVDSSMGKVLATGPEFPTTWDYENDHIVATTVSRDVGNFFGGHLHLEPEVGIGQRFTRQNETEVWGALFLRFRHFPWDRYVTTTFALSTGLNWASDISQAEKERAKDETGSRVMHFFAPEITLASPRHPNTELMFRFHHRSGVFGLVSDAWGGAQYGTMGIRVRF